MATLGVLYPGYASEIDYVVGGRLVVPSVDVFIVHTAVDDNTNTVEDARRTGEPERLAKGVRALRSAARPTGFDVVLWACTAGSFVYGLEGARRQADALAAEAGVSATSTSLAFVEAALAMGIRRVSVGASYPADEAALFGTFLGEAGIDVLAVDSAGIENGSGGAWLTEDELVGLLLGADRDRAEAILLPDTAIATMPRLEKLEAAAGKPVLTANQVTIWDGLRLAGVLRPQEGLGSLFRVDLTAIPGATTSDPSAAVVTDP